MQRVRRSPAIPVEVMTAMEGLGVSRESWRRIGIFIDLLFSWQARINLVSDKSLSDVWHRHVLDSLQLLQHLPSPTSKIADLGSGSGFPALPLAIAAGCPVHMFESNNKKAAFLREALRVTGTEGVVHAVRLEAITAADVRGFSLVTARALAPLEALLGFTEPFFKNGAVGLFHKGQDVEGELTQAQKCWRIQFTKLTSLTDSEAVLLLVKEAVRVEHQR